MADDEKPMRRWLVLVEEGDQSILPEVPFKE